jgi:TonB family protein
MRFWLRLLPICFLILLPPVSVMAQTASVANAPKPGTDGVYEVPASNLKKLDSSPALEFPRELSAYEVRDTVAMEVTVSPEGKVRKAKAVSGNIEALKDAAEKTVKTWAFEPCLVNGTPVPVRTQITLNFNNTLDHYRDPNVTLRCIWTKSPQKHL